MRQPNTNTLKINNMEDIKTGEYCRVLGYVGYKNENEVSVTFNNKPGVQTSIDFEHKEARKLLSPISEPPKYDPCRKFRRGDKVRVVKNNGRETQIRPAIEDLYEKILTVVGSEDNDNDVLVETSKGNRFIQFSFLELITPVEELERYVVEPSDIAWFVVDKKHESGKQNVVMYMCAFHPHAKEAAEAERDRLNAEYRKKQNND